MKNLLRLAIGSSIILSMGGIAFGQHYTQVNLVSSIPGEAPTTDANLVGGGGISRAANGGWWVADTVTGVTTSYSGTGAKGRPVTIPPNVLKQISKTGSPTGIIAGPTDFFLPATADRPPESAEFFVATLDGTIAAYTQPRRLPTKDQPIIATTFVSTKDGSAYTGLTSSKLEGTRLLYVANFGLRRIDVYDTSFHLVHLDIVDLGPGHFSFFDPEIPDNYAPSNAQAIGDSIVVTYAMKNPATGRPIGGPGLGYVDIYSVAGKLQLRLEHGDQMNAPWAVALAPNDFGGASHELLIGQFAGAGTTENSGTIAAYSLTTGQYLGQLKDATGAPVAINGLGGFGFANPAGVNFGPPAVSDNYDPAGAPGAELYFAAGPNLQTEGLFGYLKPVTSDLIDGNDQ